MLRWALVAALLAAPLAACSEPGDPGPHRLHGVVVASFDFGESQLLGEIYAQALEGAGVPVRRELSLGPRELVLPALRQGLVDVVPEYLGTALAAVTDPVPGTTGADSGRSYAALVAALADEGLRALSPAAAQNRNGLAVTRATADRLSLRRTSDLRGVAGTLTLTGPAECPSRPYCLPGLSTTYGLGFAGFVPYDSESSRLTALEQGVVDVAVVFTTGALLAAGDLVLLEDDRRLQPAENVVPVVTQAAVAEHGDRLVAPLEAVSEQLDSQALTFLNWRVEVAGGTVEAEAHGWLQRHDLVPR